MIIRERITRRYNASAWFRLGFCAALVAVSLAVFSAIGTWVNNVWFGGPLMVCFIMVAAGIATWLVTWYPKE